MRSPAAHLVAVLLVLLIACSIAQAFLLPPAPRSSSTRLAATAPTANAPATKEGEGEATTRLRLGVYIEHTDRYGMVYNSNYLLFLNRYGDARVCVCCTHHHRGAAAPAPRSIQSHTPRAP